LIFSVLLAVAFHLNVAQGKSWKDIAKVYIIAHRDEVVQPTVCPRNIRNISVVELVPPAIYRALPSSTIQVSVRNVYDGDTLTLPDQSRVRFLGTDTPELQTRQPCAVPGVHQRMVRRRLHLKFGCAGER
jgi:endonuclease YncB( thermonuclease family)